MLEIKATYKYAYSFSMAKMVARTRLSVTLYVHCLSCVCLPCEQYSLRNGTLTRYYHHHYPCPCSVYLVKPFDTCFIKLLPLSRARVLVSGNLPLCRPFLFIYSLITLIFLSHKFKICISFRLSSFLFLFRRRDCSFLSGITMPI
jgi:hypothetical protein